MTYGRSRVFYPTAGGVDDRVPERLHHRLLRHAHRSVRMKEMHGRRSLHDINLRQDFGWRCQQHVQRGLDETALSDTPSFLRVVFFLIYHGTYFNFHVYRNNSTE